MKICIGFYGQMRFVELGASNTLANIHQLGADKIETVFHTWQTTKPEMAANWARRHQILLSDLDEATALLNPVAYDRTEHQLGSRFESICRQQNDNELCFNLAQMFYSIDSAVALMASRNKNYDSYVLSRFDFWSDFWVFPTPGENKVLSPKIIPTSGICDWFLILDDAAIMKMASSPIMELSEVIFELGPTLAGEEILGRYFNLIGLSVEPFQAGGRLVRDSNAKVFWGRPNFRSRPLLFCWKTLRGVIGVKIVNPIYSRVRKILGSPIAE